MEVYVRPPAGWNGQVWLFLGADGEMGEWLVFLGRMEEGGSKPPFRVVGEAYGFGDRLAALEFLETWAKSDNSSPKDDDGRC